MALSVEGKQSPTPKYKHPPTLNNKYCVYIYMYVREPMYWGPCFIFRELGVFIIRGRDYITTTYSGA